MERNAKRDIATLTMMLETLRTRGEADVVGGEEGALWVGAITSALGKFGIKTRTTYPLNGGRGTIRITNGKCECCGREFTEE